MSKHGQPKTFTDEELEGTFQHAFETPVGMNCKGTGLKIIEQRDDGYCICGDPPTKERPNPAKLTLWSGCLWPEPAQAAVKPRASK